MKNRNPISQVLHDKVIRTAVEQLDKVNFDVYSNVGNAQVSSVGVHYPDIIITKKGERTVQYIIEVETSDSVTIEEAMNQWQKFSLDIKASFYLLVPEALKNTAVHLCKRVGITVGFGTYSTDAFGNITQIRYV